MRHLAPREHLVELLDVPLLPRGALLVGKHLSVVLSFTLQEVRWVFLNKLEIVPENYLHALILVSAVLNFQGVVSIRPFQYLLIQPLNLFLFSILLHFADSQRRWFLY